MGTKESTFRIPQAPIGLGVLLLAVLLIAGVILLDRAAGIGVADSNSGPGSTTSSPSAVVDAWR